ncbi:hypothetical protein [Citrobacter braakii]|uniref:hypothetical protein n=1 Tax=Citrobacter braakii TaxID=57706 RepID=UPI002FF6A927
MNMAASRAASGFAQIRHQKSAFFCKNAHFCAQAKNPRQPLRHMALRLILRASVVSRFYTPESAREPHPVCVFVVLVLAEQQCAILCKVVGLVGTVGTA